jgi:hypothetical protein
MFVQRIVEADILRWRIWVVLGRGDVGGEKQLAGNQIAPFPTDRTQGIHTASLFHAEDALEQAAFARMRESRTALQKVVYELLYPGKAPMPQERT